MTQYGEAGRPDRAAPDFLGEHFPLAPEAIRAAYQQYRYDTQPSYQAANEQSLNMTTINTLMHDFYSGHLTPQAYGGAMLAPLVQLAVESDTPAEERGKALDALCTYVSTTSESYDEIIFALGLAADQPVIRNYQNELISKLYPDSEQPWAQKPVGASPHDLLRIRTDLGVNIESHLIAGVNSLRWFLSYDPANYADALQRARRAESLHAPMSEILGYDGTSMALQSHLHTMRLRQLGESQYVEQAKQQLQHLSNPHEVDRRIGQMLTAARGHSQHSQPLKHGERHGIMIGEGITGSEELRTVWRLKTVGSTANKLRELSTGSTLTDIVGTTVITNDAYQSGQVLADTIARAYRDPRFTLRSSPKRTMPIHVRGAPDYIHEVARGMGFSSVDELRQHADVRQTSTDDYQVAKVAYDYQQWDEPKPLSVELQTNRAEDRSAARIGTANHAFYKLTGQLATPEEAEVVAQINRRAEFLGQNGLTQQSRERAAKLLHDIYAHAENR